MKPKVKAFEVTGALFIIALGTPLHFLYEWSGKLVFAAVFSPVNDSVWEHLKIIFWPSVLFAAIEYKYVRRFFREESKNFFLPKAAGIFTASAAIIVLFYTYTGITGRHFLPVDIIIFIAAVVLGQYVGHKLLVHPKMKLKCDFTGAISICILGLLFIIFTFTPPHIPLFIDPQTGSPGIRQQFQ